MLTTESSLHHSFVISSTVYNILISVHHHKPMILSTYLQGNAMNLVLWVVKLMEVLCNACLIALFSYSIGLNPCKHSVLFVGHRQTM